MRCRACGYVNQHDAAYCGQCRAALTHPCDRCGAAVAIGAPACASCGAATAPEPAAAAYPPAAPRQPAPQRRAAPQSPARPAPPPRPPTGPPQRPPQREGRAFTGVVRDLQQRTEGSAAGNGRTVTIWSFRLERHDAHGNRLAPVPVQIRGYTFSGAVANGDQVRVAGRWKHGTLKVDKLANLTTGADVRAKSRGCLGTIAIAFFVILFLVVVAVMIGTMMSVGLPAPSPGFEVR